MSLETLRSVLGPEIEDPEEETFLLFSQDIPSQNLGFLDSTAAVLELTVAGRDLTIHQSPAVLSSNRAGGTTGAVVWKITPLFAEWLASPGNALFRAGALTDSSAVLELGCGVSAIVGLTLAAHVSRYVLTDQPYVAKLVGQNLDENKHLLLQAPRHGHDRASARNRSRGSRQAGGGGGAGRSHAADRSAPAGGDSVRFAPLDWEKDEVTAASALALTGSADVRAFDAILACDCIYNESLIEPFVRTCVDVCRLRRGDETSPVDAAASGETRPCVCVVAQQLRNSDVFEAWARRFCQSFHALRVPDEQLPEGLRSAAGFVVHVGILRY